MNIYFHVFYSVKRLGIINKTKVYLFCTSKSNAFSKLILCMNVALDVPFTSTSPVV